MGEGVNASQSTPSSELAGELNKLTPKERAELLRRQAASAPKSHRVVVEQMQGEAPTGVRFRMEIDTRTRTYNVNIEPDSAEGMVAFLESLRWAANQVGVDFDIRRNAAKAQEKVARLV